MVASIGTQTCIATARELPVARGLGNPCEVELLGEFSPLGYLDEANGSRHDIDHNHVATTARDSPVDTDAAHVGNAIAVKPFGD